MSATELPFAVKRARPPTFPALPLGGLSSGVSWLSSMLRTVTSPSVLITSARASSVSVDVTWPPATPNSSGWNLSTASLSSIVAFMWSSGRFDARNRWPLKRTLRVDDTKLVDLVRARGQRAPGQLARSPPPCSAPRFARPVARSPAAGPPDRRDPCNRGATTRDRRRQRVWPCLRRRRIARRDRCLRPCP